jgi:enoyl-CoA hydratase
MTYDEYQHLKIDLKPNGVLFVTLNRPDVMNATNARLHWELTQIWKTVDDDEKAKVVLVTGAGKAFSAGGDLEMIENMTGNPAAVAQAMREAGDIVYNMINLDKPIVSAINGVAVGAGLAVALMADVSDHAAIVWPLLCGMAKAKYYLLTAEFIDGKEAERIGLVSLCAPPDRLMDKAWEVADKLAAGPQLAQRWTKRALNNWMRVAGPIFDASLAFEMLNFLGPDVREGVAGIKEKRAPRFPSAR